MKLTLLMALMLCASFVYAQQTVEEIDSRLDFIKQERAKINERINSGQDKALFEGALKKFDEEEKALLEKKGDTVPQKVEKKIAKKSLKKATKRKSKSKEQVVAVSAKEFYNLKRQVDRMQRAQNNAPAPTTSNMKLKTSGHYQMRGESATNRQGVQGTNQSGEIFSRLRANFDFTANNKLSFRLAPQAIKGFGGESGGKVTSGSTNHTDVQFFEARVNYQLSKYLKLKIGRQELAYGDHLIIGSLPWANPGRSFDAIKAEYSYKKGRLDAFWSKITDNATSGDVRKDSDDIDFYGLYNTQEINKWLNPLDIYALYRIKRTGSVREEDLTSIGIRIKGGNKDFFYRTENVVQSGSQIEDNEAYLYNVELGVSQWGQKLSVEYATAGKEYDQLYPTAHKFLGWTDVLGRTNVNHTAVHYKTGYKKWLKAILSYHQYKRNDTDANVAKLGGTSFWNVSSYSDDIGDEMNYLFKFISKDGIQLHLGGGVFNPGEYMEDQQSGEDDQIVFSYLQLLAKF